MMKKKYHVKVGDNVIVTTGDHKGKSGKVSAILKKKDRVVLEGISSGKMRTVKKTQINPHGGLVERAVSTHVSNVKKKEEV
jgi:large subunit ribosomal protein L24